MKRFFEWAEFGALLVAFVLIVRLGMNGQIRSNPFHRPDPPDCVVIKPIPSCKVIEQADYDKLNLANAQQRAAASKMSPNPNGKLPAGNLYFASATGDLVPLGLGPGLYVDDRWDPAKPMVKVGGK